MCIMQKKRRYRDKNPGRGFLGYWVMMCTGVRVAARTSDGLKEKAVRSELEVKD